MIFGAGGSIIGIIAGAICGQTTEAGFVDGACKGAVTGAIAALELLNNAEPLSKVILQVSFFFGNRWIHIIILFSNG